MDIKLPKLGEGADSGTVVGILVKAGDRLKKGQTMIELENEKAVAPIPSPADGVVARLRVKEGDRLSVGQVILELSVEGEAPSAPAPRAVTPQAKPMGVTGEQMAPAAAMAAPALTDDFMPAETESDLQPAASPTIRRVARELGIELRRVRGSEPGGRISMADLKVYIQRLERLAAQARSTSQPAAPARPVAPSIDFSQWGPVVKKPLTALRKTIAQHMAENWSTIPHVHQFDEVDVTGLDQLRQQFAPAYEAKGARLTLTSFVLVALVKTLQKHPLFNTSLEEATGTVVFKGYYNIGLAVDTEAGLIVPVLRHVEKKSLLELSREVSELARKARERTVALEELKGGTFTISNQGGIGGGPFTPIINKPEAAILGLGRSRLKPAVFEGRIEPRLLLPICLGYDHRLIDGGSAARFVVDLVEAFGAFTAAEVKPKD
jgi:pyruvate dehydrogenase E2 component (dihydrolipoamide acetyltransferase)